MAGLLAGGMLLLQAFIFLGMLAIQLLYYDKRYKCERPSAKDKSLLPGPGFERTGEVFIDPRDGLRYRVYYNAKSGERDYIRE